jgi:hypothetical protein
MMLSATVSWSAIIVSQDAAGTTGEWNSTIVYGNPVTGISEQPSLVGHSTVGQIDVTTLGQFGAQTELVYNDSTAGGALTGDYTDFFGGLEVVRAMTVEFYSYGNVGSLPSDFRLYMLAGGNSWYYEVGPMITGWSTFNVNFVHLTDPGLPFPGWYSDNPLLTLNDFYSDLATVTQLGFELQYLVNTPSQQYGFDNIILYDTYFVPEPETYLMLAVALASLAFVFREQLRESIRTAMASVAG